MAFPNESRIPTSPRKKKSPSKTALKAPKAIEQLVAELKSNHELFYKLSTDPRSVIEEIDSLNENEKALLRLVNPKDLVNLDFHGPGDIAACGGSCGASCGGSCGASCGASCGGSCGGSCGASCAGSCVASCAASCFASCVASGAMPVQEDWYTNIQDELLEVDTMKLAGIVQTEIVEFSAFMRQHV